jgi:diphthine-ammonia ligase
VVEIPYAISEPNHDRPDLARCIRQIYSRFRKERSCCAQESSAITICLWTLENEKKVSNAAVSWSGGKDSSLALYEAELSGCRINCLLTFVPSRQRFLAHPLAIMRLQAQALGIPHHVVVVEEPYERSYESVISALKDQHGIDSLVTGDVGEVAGMDPNWMGDRGSRCGIEILRPLWHHDKLELLNTLVRERFKILFSCVKRPWFSDEWLGLELSRSSIERLCELSKRTGLDICGEQGEYHTWAMGGPRFKKSITMVSYSKHADDSVMYISPERPRLADEDI